MLFLNWASAEGCITVIHLILCATLWPRYFVLHLWENKEVKHPGPGSQVGNGGGGGGASQAPGLRPGLTWPCVFLCFFFPFIFISWKLVTLQYCSGFCHTLTWISHGFTSIPHPEPPPPSHPSGSSRRRKIPAMNFSFQFKTGWRTFCFNFLGEVFDLYGYVNC